MKDSLFLPLFVFAVVVVGVLLYFIPKAIVKGVAKRVLFKKRQKAFENLSKREKQQYEKQNSIIPAQSEQNNAKELPSLFYSDELLPFAVDTIIETKQASVSMLQRRLKLGYSRAVRIIDEMENLGIVGPFLGSKPRQILISEAEWRAIRPRMEYKAPSQQTDVDIQQIIQDEEAWRREQSGLSNVEYELDKVDQMEGHAFEYWCADLLRKSGYSDVSVTQGSGDQGVDVLAKKDGIKYAVQCKCYSSDLGNKPVQEVHAGKSFYGCHVGVVLTNRCFTDGAKALAEKVGVLLWDRSTIKEMLEKVC